MGYKDVIETYGDTLLLFKKLLDLGDGVGGFDIDGHFLTFKSEKSNEIHMIMDVWVREERGRTLNDELMRDGRAKIEQMRASSNERLSYRSKT